MASPEIEDAVLDATRDCVLAYGVRRTTVSDVARRAGVSRMSIYRRWPDVRSLVADLMSREWHRVLVGTAGAPQRRGTVRRRASALIADAYSEDDLDTELGALLDRYLAPVREAARRG